MVKIGGATLEEVSPYFHLPIEVAARELGVCSSALKRRCRRLGIKRWPFRKVRSMSMSLSRTMEGMCSSTGTGRPPVPACLQPQVTTRLAAQAAATALVSRESRREDGPGSGAAARSAQLAQFCENTSYSSPQHSQELRHGTGDGHQEMLDELEAEHSNFCQQADTCSCTRVSQKGKAFWGTTWKNILSVTEHMHIVSKGNQPGHGAALGDRLHSHPRHNDLEGECTSPLDVERYGDHEPGPTESAACISPLDGSNLINMPSFLSPPSERLVARNLSIDSTTTTLCSPLPGRSRYSSSFGNSSRGHLSLKMRATGSFDTPSVPTATWNSRPMSSYVPETSIGVSQQPLSPTHELLCLLAASPGPSSTFFGDFDMEAPLAGTRSPQGSAGWDDLHPLASPASQIDLRKEPLQLPPFASEQVDWRSVQISNSSPVNCIEAHDNTRSLGMDKTGHRDLSHGMPLTAGLPSGNASHDLVHGMVDSCPYGSFWQWANQASSPSGISVHSDHFSHSPLKESAISYLRIARALAPPVRHSTES